MSTIKVAEIEHPSNSNNSIAIATDSSVTLKHSGNSRLNTTATGVNITGTCAATTLSGSLASSNLTGALPAIDGSALTGITSGIPATGGTFTGQVNFNNWAVFNASIIEGIQTPTSASTLSISPGNKGIAYLTLASNSTITMNMATGQSLLLVVTATSSNYTITWSGTGTMRWVGGNAPTLGGATPTAIEFWHDGTYVNGATVGDLS